MRDGAKEGSGYSGTGSKEVESVKLCPVLEIKDSAVRIIRVVGNYRQTTAAKVEAHTSVVQMAIQIWQSGASLEELLGLEDYAGYRKLLKITHGGQTR